jgi:hypothetical protein
VVIDLSQAARLAAAKAAGKAPLAADAHPGWRTFIARMERERAAGRNYVKKTFDTLWAGYRIGFEDCASAVSNAFQTGDFKMEGQPASWWVDLRGLAARLVEDNETSPEALQEAFTALKEHLAGEDAAVEGATFGVDTGSDPPTVEVPGVPDNVVEGLFRVVDEETDGDEPEVNA